MDTIATSNAAEHRGLLPPITRKRKKNKGKGIVAMKKYKCTLCGYIYDPEIGDPSNDIEPGTSFEDLPDDWTCPECGAGKDEFEPL